MRAFAKLVISLILISPLAIAVLAWFMLGDVPAVTDAVRLSHEDIARARDILETDDPGRRRGGGEHTITVPAHDLDLATNYLARQLFGGKARARLGVGELYLEASHELRFLPAHNVINLAARVRTRDGRPEIDEMRIGRVPVPGTLATWVARHLVDAWYRRAGLDPAIAAVHDLKLYSDRLQLTYRWDPRLIDEARDSLLTSVDREALHFYQQRLVELQSRGVGNRGPLTELLQPLFRAALERSGRTDPVTENTALLTVLGTWAGRRDLGRLLPGTLPRPRGFRLKLQGRADFAQHFLVSAALAARGDGSLSDAVGVFKEISDSDHGSGFSFTDIAADRSGTRFGELATRSRADAGRLQRLLAEGVREEALMPPARDLPEHMDAASFAARYGSVGSPAYQAVMAEIDRRIDGIPLYRD